MTNLSKSSQKLNLILWAAQVLLAVLLLSGFVMKFMPVEKISIMMPWTGQVPVIIVRLLGIIDLAGAIGMILPLLLKIKAQLTIWAAFGIVLLMLSAIVFHVTRGEVSVIGVNILTLVIAGFVGWGRSGVGNIDTK